jgi:hypothetical protein
VGCPFIVADLGADTDPFMLHLFAALAEKVGDEFRIGRCRELNNSIESERLSHGPLHRPQSS